jgi:hypothetical protein
MIKMILRYITVLIVVMLANSAMHSQIIPAASEPVATSDVTCNKYGAWLWYLKLTKFRSHEALADTLASLGVKRIYIKVADGTMDLDKWPEILDYKVPEIYAQRGIEAWAWSYNYPGNETAQAKAVYEAAKHGYRGYVVDVEVQYNGKPHLASRLFKQVELAKEKAMNEGVVGPHNFPIYCTTWGNPRNHNFPIATINQYVDAFMPQTYIENWGNEHLVTLELTIDQVNAEYRFMGCTKPVHHILSTEKGVITPEHINRFISYAGEETSIWPIPGVNTSMFLWRTWGKVDWDYDHCNTNREEYISKMRPDIKVHVYTKRNEIVVEEPINSLQILNQAGTMVAEIFNPTSIIDISGLGKGSYTMQIIDAAGALVTKNFYKRK